MRTDGRLADALRPVVIEMGVNRHAEGSCIVSFGHTRVLCTATVEERVPPFLRNTGKGWVTAEYAMLPRSTHSRSQREVAKGRQSGRTMEIQRLIGRSLRAVTLLDHLGERQIVVDCDVLQADGGTRTASITGAYVALHEALQKLVMKGDLKRLPLREPVAAVSCGLVKGEALLDLDYSEDNGAEADANFVLTRSGKIVEMQVTAEEAPLEPAQIQALQRLAESGVTRLVERQLVALAEAGFA
ncbi:ribonuclease PH [Geminicoccus flavidas]|uniref:ribonuclease PH n=1 Tax=Geminicoccus flavidas TaxID=2506407 RepID=UPI001358364B|nr:ribonuclease PH [Geminicoccus flavidas]